MPLKDVFQTALTASDTAAKDKLGDIRQEGGKRYKYVKFTGAIDAGDAVKYADTAAYLASEVAESTTVALVVAGIAVATHVANRFGWIQIGGYAVLTATITGSPAVGSGLTSSGTAGALAAHTAELQECGVVLHVANKQVVLQCPD